MGGSLGKLWAKAGHQVIFSHSRDLQKLKHLATTAGTNARAGSPGEAIAQSDAVLLALNPAVIEEVLGTTALDQESQLAGKVVISCMSDLKPDFTGQTIGIATDLKISIAETVQQMAPAAHVFEAFNLTFAEIAASESRQFGLDKPSIFYCGDHPGSRATVETLIEDCGYQPIDAGGLIVSRSLETLASVWVQFAIASQKFGSSGSRVVIV
ncbi:NAD(P)-binding domain-containing protein [Nodosilinea sp. LEGE 07088]|nr:NAD(P)-binding domain-containing protein [Nodosilinea sp. LEGE 07088]